MIKNKLYLSVVVVALLCLAGWTGNAQRSSSVKQTWEYKVVLVGRVTDAQRDAQDMTQGLSEIGAQGWELVAIDPASSTMMGSQAARYCFKRPK